MKLTELQLAILNGLADDYEDVEQLYLYANRDFAKEQEANIQFPLMLVRIRFPLRDIIDEVLNLMHEGYVEAKYSNDERLAPLSSVSSATAQHYWFGATEKGTKLWESQRRR